MGHHDPKRRQVRCHVHRQACQRLNLLKRTIKCIRRLKIFKAELFVGKRGPLGQHDQKFCLVKALGLLDNRCLGHKRSPLNRHVITENKFFLDRFAFCNDMDFVGESDEKALCDRAKALQIVLRLL